MYAAGTIGRRIQESSGFLHAKQRPEAELQTVVSCRGGEDVPTRTPALTRASELFGP
jgi:hypothetical protein